MNMYSDIFWYFCAKNVTELFMLYYWLLFFFAEGQTA